MEKPAGKPTSAASKPSIGGRGNSANRPTSGQVRGARDPTTSYYQGGLASSKYVIDGPPLKKNLPPKRNDPMQ